MSLNLQNRCYDRIMEEEIPVILYLKNGVQIRGELIDFDEFSLLVDPEEQKGEQILLKNGITTVEPADKVEDYFPEEF